MGHSQRTMIGIAWSAVNSYGSVLTNFLVFACLARFLSPQQFGVAALATLVVDIGTIIARAGVVEAVVQRPVVSPEYLDTAFWTGLGTGSLLAVFVGCAVYLVVDFFGTIELFLLIVALCPSFIVAGAAAASEAQLIRSFEFRALAGRTLLGNLAGGVVGVSMAATGYGAWSVVGQRLTQAFAGGTATALAARWLPRRRWRRSLATEQLRFGGTTVGTNLVGVLSTRVHDVVAAALLPLEAVGFLRLAWRCMDLVGQLTIVPVITLALPTFSRLAGDPLLMSKSVRELLGLAALFSLPAFLGLGVVASSVIPLVFGPQWAPSAEILRVLSGLCLPLLLSMFLWPALISVGRGRRALYLSAANLAVSGVASALGAAFSLEWLVIMNLIRAYTMLPISLIVLTQTTPVTIRTLLDALIRPTMAAMAMTTFLWPFKVWLAHVQMSSTASLMIICAAGILLYIIFAGVLLPDFRRISRALVARAGDMLKP